MNVANLQLEGLMMAVATINNVLVHKGLVSIDDINDALLKAEASVTGDERSYEDMSDSNRDAICFPIRLLQLANNAQGATDILPFSELAKWLGRPRSHIAIRCDVLLDLAGNSYISLLSMMPASPSLMIGRAAVGFLRRTPGPPSAVSPSLRKATPASSNANCIAASLSGLGTRLPFSNSRTVPSLTLDFAPSLACGQLSSPLAARHCSRVNWIKNMPSLLQAPAQAVLRFGEALFLAAVRPSCCRLFFSTSARLMTFSFGLGAGFGGALPLRFASIMAMSASS